jgi:Protein of unknown function (DUF998)
MDRIVHGGADVPLMSAVGAAGTRSTGISPRSAPGAHDAAMDAALNDGSTEQGADGAGTPGSRRAGPAGPPEPRAPHRATGASLVVLIAATVTFVGIMVLHGVRSDLDPLHDVMSHYANGADGPVMSVVFYAFGLSAFALGLRLRSAIDRRGVVRAFPALLSLAGLLLVAAGVFEVDRPLAPQTVQEVIHSNSAVAAFVLLVVSMLLFSHACWSDERWWSVRWVSLVLAVTAALAAVGTQLAGRAGYSGVVQRVLAGTVLAWIAMAAVHVRRRRFRA